MQRRELTPDFPFALRQFLRDANPREHIQIAATAGCQRQPMFSQTKPLLALSSGGNLEPFGSFQRRHLQLRAERRLPRRDFHLVHQVAAFD